MASALLEKQLPVTPIGVVAPPPILVQTPAFEGTLAALFRCVRDHKVDLLEVPLEPICEAYLEYLVASAESDLDEAAAALTVLAYLLERKAWLLLPVEAGDEPEFEEPAALSDPTTYAYADIILALVNGFEDRSQLFFRSSMPAADTLYELPVEIGEVSTEDLARAFERLLRKANPEPIELISKPRRSIAEQMKLVLASLTKEFRTLEAMFVGDFTRTDAVYWFLALLELIRLNKAVVKVAGKDVTFARR